MRFAWTSLVCACTTAFAGCSHDDSHSVSITITIDGEGGGIVIATVAGADPISCTHSCEIPVTTESSLHLEVFTQDLATSPCGDDRACDVVVGAGDDVAVHFDVADEHERTSLYLDRQISGVAFLDGDLIVSTSQGQHQALRRVHLDGTSVWDVPLDAGASLALANHDLILVTLGMNGFAVYRADGTSAWGSSNQLGAIAVGDSGDVIISDQFARVTALDRTTGRVHWAVPGGGEDGITGYLARDGAGNVAYTYPQSSDILRFDANGTELAPFTPALVGGFLAFLSNGDLVEIGRDFGSAMPPIQYVRITPTGTATAMQESSSPPSQYGVTAQGDDFFEVAATTAGDRIALVDANAATIWSVTKTDMLTGASCDGDGMCAITGRLDDCEPTSLYACSWIELFSTP